MTTLKRVGRIVSFCALAALAAAYAAIYLLEGTAACQEISTAKVECDSATMAFIANTSQAILLTGVFTIVPLIFAFAGALFAVGALIDYVRGRVGRG